MISCYQVKRTFCCREIQVSQHVWLGQEITQTLKKQMFAINSLHKYKYSHMSVTLMGGGGRGGGVRTSHFLYLVLLMWFLLWFPPLCVLFFLLQNITQCCKMFSYFSRVPSLCSPAVSYRVDSLYSLVLPPVSRPLSLPTLMEPASNIFSSFYPGK